MSTNNKISNLVSSQMPFFVRNDHEKFVSFVEAYYEFLEQNNNLVDRAQALKTGFDVDESIDLFTEHLNAVFLKLIPDNIAADKALLLKNVKDFYRARGTEKSIEFLLRVLFGSDTQDATFYYPKRDILRASDGKWFIEKSLKFFDSKINGVANTDFTALQNFEGKKITGNTSNATAFVEKIETYYDGVVLIRELKLSNQYKDFSSGETIFTTFEENGETIPISANIYGGIINSVYIQKPGTGYVAGTQVPIESNTGSGAIVQIDEVSAGNIKSIFVVSGGAGFRNNDFLLFTTSGTGSGANANVSVVLDNNSVHPNSYNIVYSTIDLVANVNIGNSLYPALNTAQTDPANAAISQSMSYFIYGNTGPIVTITVLNSGNNYSLTPNVSVVANTRIKELGILGRMNVVNAGTGYSNSDTIEFINVFGGYGTGAAGNVVVDANGSILRVGFTTVPGFLPGGSGYDQNYLPIANVVTSTGSNANVVVTSTLGHGEILQATSEVLGAIRKLSIVSGGTGYDTIPTLNLTSFGDGTAQANATIVTGVYTYPGRYLNDDGHLSGYNFLEDRDYYQNFSYVVRTNQSIEKYRKYLKDLIHPAGMKLFGEHLKVDQGETSNQRFQSTTTIDNIFVLASYKSLANTDANTTTIEVTTTRDITGITNAYVEFIGNERIRSNLTLLVDSLTTGLLSTTGNLVSKESVANTSNLEARVAVGNNETRIELVTFTPINNTSNLEIRTSKGIPTNVASFVQYQSVANTSNLEVKIGSGASVDTIQLVKYTPVAQTSNIEVRTGAGVNTNTASLVVYTLLNTLSNVRVNTAVGSSTNTATLVKIVVDAESTTNLRANSTVSVGNTINLIKFENDQAVSNLGVNTVSVVEGDATNVINLIKYIDVSNTSNIVIGTHAAIYSTNTASLYRVVSIANTSNLEVRTGYGDANNVTREIRFVQYTPINKSANIEVRTINAPTKTLSIVAYTPVNNTSNLKANTGIGATTNSVILNRNLIVSNVFFTTDYVIQIGASEHTITSSNPNAKSFLVTPAITGNLKLQTVKVISLTKDAWISNSNVFFTNGYTLNIAGANTVNVISSNPNSNVFTVDANIASNLTNGTVIVESYYKPETLAKSNVAFDTNYTINIGSQNTVTISFASQDSNIAYLTHGIPGNLSNSSIVVVSQYADEWAGNSNVYFSNGYSLNIGSNSYVISNVSNTSNVITFTFDLPGSIVGNTIFVESYYRKEIANNSNVAIGVGYRLNINGSTYIVTAANNQYSNVTISPPLPGGITANSLTINTWYKDQWVANSNVAIGYDYRLNIAGNTHTVTGISSNSSTITVTPAIQANLFNSAIVIEPYYRNEWIANANLTIGTNYTINVGGQNTVTIITSTPNTSIIDVSPALPGGVVANTLTVVSFYKNLTASQSNVAFGLGYILNVGGSNTVTVTGFSSSSNTINVTPALNGNIANGTLTVDAFYKPQTLNTSNVFFGDGYTLNINSIEVTILSSNQSSNVLTVTPGLAGNVANANVFVRSFFKDTWLGNSNVAISNNYIITVGGTDVEILESSATSNRAVMRTNLPSGLTNGTIVVKSIYSNQWAGNSNVAIGNNYVLNINNQSVLVTKSASDSNVLSIAPGITGNLANAKIVVEAYYRNQWLQNSNTYITTGDTLIVGNTNTVIGVSAANSSKITFGMGLAGNTINANVTVVRPIELSNGFFTVTANGSNAYIYVEAGKKVNANGSVYTSI